MGYPKDLITPRAVVKPGLWALIPESGLVNNVLPNLEKCRVSIVASPKLGASFAEYSVTARCGGKTLSPFAQEDGIESFLYVLGGRLEAKAGETSVSLGEGGYVYSPQGIGISFKVTGEKAKFILYKQRYISYGNLSAEVITGNSNDIPFRVYDEMDNVFIKDLLPTDNLAFDMNMHILSFLPGGCHPFAETHVQEHGAYITRGKGVYMMDERWLEVKKNDFMWFGAYCPQCAYGVGTEPFEYIYSKDCNRDVTL